MADETVHIEALYGPFRGIISVPADVGKAAVKDGWARDPYSPYTPPENLDVVKATAAAEKAARKLRGEPEPDEKPKDKPAAESKPAAAKAETEDRSFEATDKPEDGYETRAASAAKKPASSPKK